MPGAGIDDELHIGAGGRLTRGQPGASRRRRHLVERADENHGGDFQRRARQIFARRIIRRRRLEAEAVRGDRRERGRDLEGRVAALRIANHGDPGGIDVRALRQVQQGAPGIGRPLAKFLGAGLPQAARRKIVDEQCNVAPARQGVGDRPPVAGQAEAGMQQRHRGERPGPGRSGQVTADLSLGCRRAGQAGEFNQFLGRRGRRRQDPKRCDG